MKKRALSLFVLIFVVLLTSLVSAENYGYNKLEEDFSSGDLDGICGVNNRILFRSDGTWQCANLADAIVNLTLDNITINNNFSNFADIWITNEGNADTVNSTQFQIDGDGILTVLTGWIETFSDGLYCRLTGCNMTGDINMTLNDISGVDELEVFGNITMSSSITSPSQDIQLYLENGTLVVEG